MMVTNLLSSSGRQGMRNNNAKRVVVLWLCLLQLLLLLHQCRLSRAQEEKRLGIFGLELFVGDVITPVHMADPLDGSDRLFVVEQGGVIKVRRTRPDTGEVVMRTFLNVTHLLGPCEGYCLERGLLGLAFHPMFRRNGFFFINYTTQDEEGNVFTIVSRWRVSRRRRRGYRGGGRRRGGRVDPRSERIVLKIQQPFANANAGDLHFGPDGYLYVPTGDGGGAGDPLRNGQNPQSLLGKMLRIDVDHTYDPYYYSIPEDNPFFGDPGVLGEIWAMGFRNPWRISFDRLTGDFFIADVGHLAYEEVNIQPAGSPGGQNYGWNTMEGPECFSLDPQPPKPEDCNRTGLTLPTISYSHEEYPDRCSVVSGYRYRGTNIPALYGWYLYTDYCTGEILVAKPDEDGTTWTSALALQAPPGMLISSFAQDRDGELYVLSYFAGEIYRLIDCASVRADDPDFIWQDDPAQTCAWLADQDLAFLFQTCRGDAMVQESCKATCTLCTTD